MDFSSGDYRGERTSISGVGLSLWSARETAAGVGLSLWSARETGVGVGLSLWSARETGGAGVCISRTGRNLVWVLILP